MFVFFLSDRTSEGVSGVRDLAFSLMKLWNSFTLSVRIPATTRRRSKKQVRRWKLSSQKLFRRGITGCTEKTVSIKRVS